MESYNAPEVVPHRCYAEDPEVVPGQQSLYPEVVPGENVTYPEVDRHKTFGLDAPEPLYSDYGHDRPQYDLSADTSAEAIHHDEKGAGQRSRVCGMEKRVFLTLLGFAIVIIIGVVVGVTAGILTNQKHSDNAGTPNTPTVGNDTGSASSTSHLLSNSSFSAVNFTDPQGYNHRLLFFQDGNNNIIERRWDSQNNTWATTNISQVMSNSTTPVNLPLGSALAATAYGSMIDLFLIDSNNMIRSLLCVDAINLPDLWLNYTLNDTLYTYPGSRLAATQKGCGPGDTLCSCNRDSCTAGWTFAFQRQSDGAVVTTNYSSAWTARELAMNSNEVMASSSLALVDHYQGEVGALGLVSQRYLSGTEGDVRVTKYGDDYKWDITKADSIITNVPSPATTEHVVVTKWRNWATTLSYVLLSNGTLRGSWWDNSTTTALNSITLEGAPANVNFTSIAMTNEAVLYGIYNDTILEFTVDDSDPSRLHYVTTVYP